MEGGTFELNMIRARSALRELTARTEDGVTISNSSYPLTPPSPDPDESVIQRRGHTRKSASYNYGAPDPVFFRTPTKSPKKTAIPRLSTPTRSSPRKKLNLTPVKPSDGIPLFNFNLSNRKLQLSSMDHTVNIDKNIKALSHAQLVQLINDAATNSPGIKEILSSLVPVPDLEPVESRLYVLQRNVYKAFPRNIWGNEDGTFCFLRVRAHLESFKKECYDYCRQFMESQHWPSVFQYILSAWKLTIGLPNWSSATHNKIKSSCMKHLANQCVNAFKKCKIDENSLNEIIQRLEELGDYSEVQVCVAYAKNLMKDFDSSSP